jgi:hypothetical protein
VKEPRIESVVAAMPQTCIELRPQEITPMRQSRARSQNLRDAEHKHKVEDLGRMAGVEVTKRSADFADSKQRT